MQHFHFIGIGGIGMSALARILLSQKIKVTGSDVAQSSIIEALTLEGAHVHIGHAKGHVQKGATVVYNSMINKDHPEFAEALLLNCKILHRSDLLKMIGRSYKTLSVTGTHGKTTTSSLLTSVLKKALLDPAYAIGGILLEEEMNGGYGKGEYFVVEADESDASFLKYPTFGAIVTNIDDDHMDHYGSKMNLRNAFLQFMENVQEEDFLFWCRDDATLLTFAEKGISYGFKSNAELLGLNYRQEGWTCFFDVQFRGKKYVDVELSLVGRHQASNALAVFGMALCLGVSEAVIRDAFKNFGGVGRRCEKKCDKNNVTILDDYAHHPTEIGTTLNGVRKAIGSNRLIAVFQPHRYSRTEHCLDQFGDAFNEADEVIVTDLYGAFETPIPGINAEAVVKKIQEKSSVPCRFIPKKDLKLTLLATIRPHDVVITLNAGDINKISAELGEHFSR
ncbi:MAG: UDP-N-acetylmuramate--L-alanine ligase [Chlamydiales bacterium]|nr:UDP-N-acetylmuramate--L-alanine ligase [Chlamydiales bacterium]